MVPGAVDELPLNVQFSIAPPFDSEHVSEVSGPVTPKFAVACVGRVTANTAEADIPAYDALIVAEIVPPTARVVMVNVALVDPDGTVTTGGTFTGSLPVSDTSAPLAGAAALKVTVPVTVWPPTTVGALSDSDDSMAPDVTVTLAV